MSRTLAHIREKAVATLFVDKEGLIARTLSFRGEENQIPLVLIRIEGNPAAELGIGRCHPYRSRNARVKGGVSLARRMYDHKLQNQHVAALSRQLMVVLTRLVRLRSVRWNTNGITWNHDNLYGVTVSIHERDTALLQLFEELETLNPAFWYKLRDFAEYFNRFPLRKKQRGAPASWSELTVSLKGDRHLVWTRPHVLAELALRMRRGYGPLLLQFLAEQGVITPAAYGAAVQHFGRRIQSPDQRILPFQVLPKDAADWNVIDRQEGMPVLFSRILRDGTRTILICERRVDYYRRRDAAERDSRIADSKGEGGLLEFPAEDGINNEEPGWRG